MKGGTCWVWRGRERLEIADFWGNQVLRNVRSGENVGFIISRHEDLYDQRSSWKACGVEMKSEGGKE